MTNWKVGDKARVVYVKTNERTVWKARVIVTISDLNIKLTPSKGDSCDCEVRLSGGAYAYPFFDQLEPITEELSSWEAIQEMTNWNPSKEVVK